MSMHRHAALDDTVYLYFASNNTAGSGDDGATPAAHVRLGGALAADAPIHSPTPTLLTNAGYPAGCHEVAVVCSAANGFAAGSSYGVFCTLAVDAQNPTGFIGGVTLAPVPADVVSWIGQAVTLSSTTLKPEVDMDSVSDSTLSAAVLQQAYASPSIAQNFEDFYNGTGFAGGTIKLQTDVVQLNTDAAAASNLQTGASALRAFVVGASPSATSIPTDITGLPFTNANHFKDRVVTINQETKKIIGSSGSPVVLTVSDFVSVPSQNDIGVIS